MFSQIDLNKANATSDFGGGFYLTNILEQAVEWAGKRRRIQFDGELSAWEDFRSAYVLKYELSFDVLKKHNMNLKIFSEYDREWLDIILLGRRHLDRDDSEVVNVNNLLCEYDIIAGPMADNNLNVKLNEYARHPYDREELLKEIKMSKENYQIVFKTTKSLNALKKLQDFAYIQF